MSSVPTTARAEVKADDKLIMVCVYDRNGLMGVHIRTETASASADGREALYKYDDKGNRISCVQTKWIEDSGDRFTVTDPYPRYVEILRGKSFAEFRLMSPPPFDAAKLPILATPFTDLSLRAKVLGKLLYFSKLT